jgi:hypothetical protein
MGRRPGPELNIDEILEKDARVSGYDGGRKGGREWRVGALRRQLLCPWRSTARSILTTEFLVLIGLQKSKNRLRDAAQGHGALGYDEPEGEKA